MRIDQVAQAIRPIPRSALVFGVTLDDRLGFLEQYRKIGFREQRWGVTEESKALDDELCRELGFNREEDTLLSLNLKHWTERQEAR